MSIDLHKLKQKIATADIYTLAKHTPCQQNPQLSQLCKRPVWLKREDLQDVFSFKIRGATNRISQLTRAQKQRGICAASAGNHAQGIATAAAHYKINATIFMPVTTPLIKVNAVKVQGGLVRLIGDNYDQACQTALEYAAETGAVFIHPFDEIDVIAGQGTIGKEILDDMPTPPAAIYVCTGGGGLISGIGTWVKAISPATRIISVEPEGAATLQASLEAGKPTPLNHIDGFADGVAVKLIGRHTLEIAKTVVDEVMTVSNDEICAAIKSMYEASRAIIEPAGALALAGLLKHIQQGRAPSGDCVVIISGANVNFDRIGHIVERAELGRGQEMLFAASIEEKPGAFLAFCKVLQGHAITEFNYRYHTPQIAHVLVGVKLRAGETQTTILARLAQQNIHTELLSHDLLTKRHVRYMVGGRAKADIHEAIYRFEFPERVGALLDFLSHLQSRWNISLFHYRNHGSSTGHVLCGFHVPEDETDALETRLKRTAYPMFSETTNIAYEYFLKTMPTQTDKQTAPDH